MTDALLETLCRMPIEFRRRGDISMVGLLKESGYLAGREPLDEARIASCLRAVPEAVDAWRRESESQRDRSAMYILGPGDTPGTGGRWVTGQAGPEGTVRTNFPDEFAATAHFVRHTIERLAELCGEAPRKRSSARRPSDPD